MKGVRMVTNIQSWNLKTQPKKLLREALLMSTHNIGFLLRNKKIITWIFPLIC